MKGMHSEGILSSAKHFPGHGDTKRDSHKFLPNITFSKGRLDSVELYPFKKLIEEGVSSIMVAHLNVPSLEVQENIPSSLSKSIVTDLLKKELKFNGLIFTDALNMKGASNYKNPGEIDPAAFMAGNDILLISEDVKKASEKIMDAYNDGTISEERLAHSVRKILFAKYKGDLYELVEGVRSIEKLKDGDTILIAEGCSHHRQSDDIGTVKIPRWIRELTGKELTFEHVSGENFPQDINQYALIVQCGGCMLNRRSMMYRIEKASEQGIPITNYGVLIAHVQGSLGRVRETFKSNIGDGVK